MLAGHCLGTPASSSTYQQVISANVSDYDVFGAAGSPTTDVVVTVTINAGVIVQKLNVGWGTQSNRHFTAGSSVTIINHGSIYGYGGQGGSGGNGFAGGDAMEIFSNVTIDNTDGQIFSGGGGGGTGSAASDGVNSAAGGGGGGGQGVPGGAAGTTSASTGQNGTATAPGAGGAGGVAGHGFSVNGGAGGSGGGWGGDGNSGDPGSTPEGNVFGQFPGGLSGAAVKRHGHTITWLGGNNTTHVKGPLA